ncbi:MAG: hypothetical protein K2Y08_01705 [Alphaproteobacteria bacterium]|nr:hypothetical protein [Alphaproteobacteria bacterium]
MIYIGFIDFSNIPIKSELLSSIIASYSKNSPTILKKGILTLCYGKLSELQDKDEIWENDSHILMGRVFYKEKSSSLKKKDFQTLSYINKEKILDKIWGKYLFISNNPKTSQFEIVIDSSGQLPFFYFILANGNVLFSSDIEFIFKVLNYKPEINWKYLYSYLIFRNSSAVHTPFKDVYELPPACCLTINKNEKATTPFWNPLSSYKSSAYQRSDAVGVLQATLKPWIEPYDNICVSLSGGLDSSALVYCLKNIKRENQTLNAINYFHSALKSSNETFHAKRVCQETGIELIEIDMSNTPPFDQCQKKQLINPNKPFSGLISLRGFENTAAHLPSKGSCSFISGHGSDHVFMCPPSKKSLTDYILEKGLKGSRKQLQKLTTFYRDPFFSILKENVTHLRRYFLSQRLEKRNPKNTQDEIPSWLNLEIHHIISSDFVHPIYDDLPKEILPGKYDQIDLLYEGLSSIHMEMDRIYPTHYPFLYEPVVEFALSFPTYDLFDKGFDRFPLRKAVSDHFKTETVWRRDKSQTTGILQLGIKKNLDYVYDLCLEGKFAREGLIDKERLCNTIKLISNGDVSDIIPFMHLASVEIYLKYWS